MSPITSHVLDTALGKPAHGVLVVLEIGRRGRTAGLSWPEASPMPTAGSPLLFRRSRPSTGRFTAFDSPREPTLRPCTCGHSIRKCWLSFEIEDPLEHYHVPLLLSPFGYSTYRGS